MPVAKKPSETPSRDSLSVELGGWFKANATGRGIFVIGVIVVALVAGALAQGWAG
jgi:hypothetical protein